MADNMPQILLILTSNHDLLFLVQPTAKHLRCCCEAKSEIRSKYPDSAYIGIFMRTQSNMWKTVNLIEVQVHFETKGGVIRTFLLLFGNIIEKSAKPDRYASARVVKVKE